MLDFSFQTGAGLGRVVSLPEFELSPLFSLDTSPVQLRNSKGYFVAHILVKNTHKNDRERRKGEVVEQDVRVIEKV